MRGPKRRQTYGMAFSRLSGVQSAPRIMRAPPVIRPRMIDVSLNDKLREQAILKAQGRVTVVDDAGNVAMAPVVTQAPLQGLDSQGFAHTLSGTCFGDDVEMDAECMRPGEVMQADGSCAKPLSPYVPAPAASVAAAKPSSKISPQLIGLGILAVGAILYFGRK